VASCPAGLRTGRRASNWSPAALRGSADHPTVEKVQRRPVHNKTRPMIGPEKPKDDKD
jgi:hypothetical protein